MNMPDPLVPDPMPQPVPTHPGPIPEPNPPIPQPDPVSPSMPDPAFGATPAVVRADTRV